MPEPATQDPVASAASAPRPGTAAPADFPAELGLRLLRVMLTARLGDELETALKRRGVGHFQISCQGHEALAGAGLALRPEDWLHPHYRDRAILLARGMTPEEFLLDYFTKRTSFSGGHQMPAHFGSRRVRVVSLSSPVSTNYLQAVGMAQSLRMRGSSEVVMATLGDAGTRQGEVFEALAQAAVERLPVVFLIEDNRWGISMCTEGQTFWTLPNSLARRSDGTTWFLGCRTELIDGLDPEEVYRASAAALERARSGQGPTCLVARVERLFSHSSSDDQRVYRSEQDIAAAWARDPVPRYEKRCLAAGWLTPRELEALKTELRKELEACRVRAQSAPDPDPASARDSAFAPLPEGLPRTEQHLPPARPRAQGGLGLAQCLAVVLAQELKRNPHMALFGLDIEDPKGDVFGITRGLSTAWPERVKNSPLAEATIMGTSVGRALLGDVAVAAIQFVDFIGPGLTQLFSEAATLYWRSAGEYNCPLVVLAPCGSYLPGLGPWHCQSNEALFAHVPGLHVVMPSQPGDAAGLLRYALRCNRPVVYLYPKCLLHSAEETVAEPDPECLVPFGQARVVRPGRDVTVVTWGYGVQLCRRAAEKAAQAGVEAEVLDLRTILPWDRAAVLASVRRTGRLLVVHEDNKTCGLGGEIIAEVTATEFERLAAPPRRLARSDDHHPYHFPSETALLPSAEDVLTAIQELGATRRVAVAAAPRVAVRTVAPASAEAQAAAASPSADGPSRRLVIKVPKQAPTDEEVQLVRWHVRAGQDVVAGTLLAEMEANKGTFEIEAPCAGRVAEVLAMQGEKVRVGAPLLVLAVEKGPGPEESVAAAEAHAPATDREVLLSPAQIQVAALALKSQLEIPVASVEAEVDLTDLEMQREALKGRLERLLPIPLSFNHLTLWALIQALRKDRHAGFRGRLDPRGDRLWVSPDVNVGFAVLGPNADLFAPVLKQSQSLTLVELVIRVQALGEAVRRGTIASSDLQGASLTLTNIGAFGASGGTPFVIPDQLAMLCASAPQPRARCVSSPGKKEPVIQRRLIMPLELVFDHRPFNGSHAAAFLRTLKHCLETLDLKSLLPVQQ